MSYRVTIRRVLYHGNYEWKVTQCRGQGIFNPCVVVPTYDAALKCKERFKANEEISYADMTLPEQP